MVPAVMERVSSERGSSYRGVRRGSFCLSPACPCPPPPPPPPPPTAPPLPLLLLLLPACILITFALPSFPTRILLIGDDSSSNEEGREGDDTCCPPPPPLMEEEEGRGARRVCDDLSSALPPPESSLFLLSTIDSTSASDDLTAFSSSSRDIAGPASPTSASFSALSAHIEMIPFSALSLSLSHASICSMRVLASIVGEGVGEGRLGTFRDCTESRMPICRWASELTPPPLPAPPTLLCALPPITPTALPPPPPPPPALTRRCACELKLEP
mmetsp:Transcript_29589/g.76428  ORF Transcript_29589/g.76428 Transcript_29589/m.76428 type:complete len:271 (-) Transcript_29589:3864-4676(-)